MMPLNRNTCSHNACSWRCVLVLCWSHTHLFLFVCRSLITNPQRNILTFVFKNYYSNHNKLPFFCCSMSSFDVIQIIFMKVDTWLTDITKTNKQLQQLLPACVCLYALVFITATKSHFHLLCTSPLLWDKQHDCEINCSALIWCAVIWSLRRWWGAGIVTHPNCTSFLFKHVFSANNKAQSLSNTHICETVQGDGNV